MKLLKRAIAAAALSVVAFAGMVTPASALPSGFYSVPYSDTLYYNQQNTNWGTVTYAQWQSAGFPTPRKAPTDFVKYPWSSTIYAVTYFDGGSWLWTKLSLQQWQRAGSPSPRNAGWIQGSYVYQWSTANEIFVQAPDATHHKFTYGEWQAAGFPSPALHANEGFQKLSWFDSIGKMTNVSSGLGGGITYNTWAQYGFPTPQAVARFPGDSFCAYPGSSQIHYNGPTAYGTLNYSQYVAAGSPAITSC